MEEKQVLEFSSENCRNLEYKYKVVPPIIFNLFPKKKKIILSYIINF